MYQLSSASGPLHLLALCLEHLTLIFTQLLPSPHSNISSSVLRETFPDHPPKDLHLAPQSSSVMPSCLYPSSNCHRQEPLSPLITGLCSVCTLSPERELQEGPHFACPALPAPPPAGSEWAPEARRSLLPCTSPCHCGLSTELTSEQRLSSDLEGGRTHGLLGPPQTACS